VAQIVRSVQKLAVQLLVSLAGPITNLQPFKVIQGNRPWCHSKAHTPQVPISD